ncbi:MAG TPA: hypothetical protein VFT59_05280 [Candidatus Saccharimonadales bacterium]|nr:hypothetical protein [Candidatus Saccharimonadales bacterium]
MTIYQKIPIQREDDGELLGFVVQDNAGWDAQTIFGYSIRRTTDRGLAEAIVREEGLRFLMGVWQYLDKDDQHWHPCVLKEAYENRVIVIRTNATGYQDPEDAKRVTIHHPSETNLVKG